MPAKNDITGDSIITGVYSAQGRENFGVAFRKKPLWQWYENEGLLCPDDSDCNSSLHVGYSEFKTHYRKNKCKN